MVTGQRLTLTLTGGAPWGFRLQGGGNYPLEVAKIRKNSHASAAGLCEGDVILSINRQPTSGRSHQSAMDIVEMASDRITFEVARSGQGPSQPPDPQRQPRIIPMISSPQDAGPGIISSAHADYTTTAGNTRTNVHTDEYVMRTGDGRKVTKTVTEQRVTRIPETNGPSPGMRRTSLGSVEHVSRSASRSPLVWHPPSQETGDDGRQSRSPLSWRPPSQASGDTGSRSANRSPVMWQSRPGKLNTEHLQKSQSLLDVHFGHRQSASPQSRSLSPMAPKQRYSSTLPLKKTRSAKENIDPIIAAEQAKWEKIHKNDDTPKYNFSAYEASKLGSKKYAPPKMDDPNYPMFEVPKMNWSPPKIVETPSPTISPKKWAPPVPPKPQSPNPSSVPFGPEERAVAGVDKHYPGMIRPPQQPVIKPAPIPPPMPPLPLTQSRLFNVVPYDSLRRSEEPSTPSSRPDHLPVFAPRVVFAPDEEGGMLSPDRLDGSSDIISTHRTDDITDDITDEISEDSDSEKIFSDSAFYDDATNRYPTIDEQMSMCKKIAQSLTSCANQRARGARMFAKRKRKADKWVHEHNRRLDLGGSEYSSSVGDIADIDELDSELYHEEGGNRPLFSFRIPTLARQVSEGQKMSMSKAEFERMRLVAPKVDHHGVSPNECFAIAADLHKGGRNKGAKLFQKRQQRVEKFVIDETNVMKSPVSPSTKLDYIVQHPQPNAQKNPWNAAAQGDVNRAFSNMPPQLPLQPMPRHNLAAEIQPKLLQGKNFNTKARGWGGSGPGQQQQSFYRESQNLSMDRSRQARDGLFDPEDPPKHLDQFGNYNNKIKAWPEQSVPEEKIEFGDYNRRIKAWPEKETEPQPPRKTVEYTDYNRKIKGWAESTQQEEKREQQNSVSNQDLNHHSNQWPGQGQTLPSRNSSQSSFSVQKSYYSLPRGFGSSAQFKQKLLPNDL